MKVIAMSKIVHNCGGEPLLEILAKSFDGTATLAEVFQAMRWQYGDMDNLNITLIKEKDYESYESYKSNS